MADQDLLDLTKVAESQLSGDDLFYYVHDPNGVALDLSAPMGSLFPLFYTISATVSGGALTVAAKTLGAVDPSSLSPLVFKIGDAWKVITAALSVTKAAATNWCNAGSAELATKPIDYFVYVISESGVAAGTKIGYSRYPGAYTMGDFVNTTTNAKYIAGNWTNFTASDPVTLIGRFRATLSAGAAYTYSIASAKIVNRPIFETDWLTWQPVGTGGGAMTYTITGTDKAEYKVRFDSMEYELKVVGTTGGVASNSIIASSPWLATNASHLIPRPAYFTDVGGVLTGHASIGSSVISVSKYDNSNFALGGGRYMASAGSYRIG